MADNWLELTCRLCGNLFTVFAARTEDVVDPVCQSCRDRQADEWKELGGLGDA